MTNKVALSDIDFVLTAISHGIGGMRAVQEKAPQGVAAGKYALEMEQAAAIVERLRKQIEGDPDWSNEVTAVLDALGFDAVRVREGGGPENLAASLAVSVAKLKRQRDEAEERYITQPKFVAIRGAQPGDVVFLTPTRDLSADEANRISKALRDFSAMSRIYTVILPVGFSVSAKQAEDNVCVYTPEDDGHGSGTPLFYDTGFQKRWHRPPGLELYPFCAHCGKPVSEATFSTDPKPKGD